MHKLQSMIMSARGEVSGIVRRNLAFILYAMRKVLLLLIGVIFSMKGVAQINVRISYDNKSKEVSLFLKNESNKLYVFRPIKTYDGYEFLSSITFSYKDRGGNLLYETYSLIYEFQHYYYQSMGQAWHLEPYAENKYVYNLENRNDSVYAVDIWVKIDARIIAELVEGKSVSTSGTYKTELRKQILLE